MSVDDPLDGVSSSDRRRLIEGETHNYSTCLYSRAGNVVWCIRERVSSLERCTAPVASLSRGRQPSLGNQWMARRGVRRRSGAGRAVRCPRGRSCARSACGRQGQCSESSSNVPIVCKRRGVVWRQPNVVAHAARTGHQPVRHHRDYVASSWRRSARYTVRESSPIESIASLRSTASA